MRELALQHTCHGRLAVRKKYTDAADNFRVGGNSSGKGRNTVSCRRHEQPQYIYIYKSIFAFDFKTLTSANCNAICPSANFHFTKSLEAKLSPLWSEPKLIFETTSIVKGAIHSRRHEQCVILCCFSCFR